MAKNALRTPVIGGSKFKQIHKVGCHLPPWRAAVAEVMAVIHISYYIF
ncbi:MAG: hypothetical protein K8R13_03560 [Methanococcoides sp.]|nr:hypothetical protein [Methanococcoides sp.]